MLYLLTLTCLLSIVFAKEDSLWTDNLRIIGGENATLGEIPYQVSMEVSNRHHCGGVIISDEWVITAAHCAVDIAPLNTTIRVGSIIREHGGEVYKVKSLTVHPNYSRIEFDYDVALIHMETKIKFNKIVNKIPMIIKDGITKNGTTATISGWGYTNASVNILSDNLLVTKVDVVDYDLCYKKYFYHHPISERMICAGWKKDIGFCGGDSGGPMTANGQLVGLVSWGAGTCANGDYPQVYSSIAKYRDYINHVTGL